MKNDSWKEYFTFSKKERVAIIILVIIIVSAVILPFFVNNDESKPVIDEQLKQQIAKLKSNDAIDSAEESDGVKSVALGGLEPAVAETPSVHPFHFDPNTLNKDGWRKLGIREKTIQTIFNYRNKGGRFKTPGDIRKIYGLKKEDADKLIPYITIKRLDQSNRHTAKSEVAKKTTFAKKKSFINIEPIDINTATAEQWKALPMIGDVLSNRIVKFRTKLGGFESIDQVKQTYGLSDSAFEIIKPYLKISAASNN